MIRDNDAGKTDHSAVRADRTWLWGLALVGGVCLAYLPVFRAGLIWDDEHYITDNPALLSARGLGQIWSEPGASPQYYPLTFTTFWFEHHVWHNQALGYHVVNVALHALSSLLLWQVLRQLNVPGAWLAAACFAIHPVQVESVAWVTERKNVLSGVFYWLALLAWLRFRPLPEAPTSWMFRWHWYAIALCCYLAALSSKTVTCSLPAVILLIAWWRQGNLTRRDWLEMAPFLALGIAFAGVTVWMEKEHVGARGPEWQFSPIERLLIAGRALAFYAGKLVWPVDLTFIYPRWKIDSGDFSQYLYPLAVLAVIAVLWFLRKRLGRGPVVAVLCFAGTLLPALGFFDVYPMRYSFVADHFQYLACAALFALAAGISFPSGRAKTERGIGLPTRSTVEPLTPAPLPEGEGSKLTAALVTPIRTAVATGLVFLLGIATWRQAHVYQNVRTIWEDTLVKNPGCWMAHNNLGKLCMEERDWPASTRHFQRTLELKPDHVNARYNLGLVEALQGFPERSIPYFESALQLQPDHPDAHTDLGMAFFELGRLADARAHLERAVQLAPRSWRAQYGLGQTMDRLGQVKQAADHYSQAIALEPHCKLAQQALRRLGQSSP
jgi:tetratricopeptide (TPR) repeat protein